MFVNSETFTVHPEKTATEKEMQSYLFLENHGVGYIRAEHDEAATIELCEQVEKVIDAKICKNLLLCNRQKTNFYLLLIPGDKKFETKKLSSQLGVARLSFADGEFMEKFLDITPGSLSVFGVANDTENNVRVLIDSDLTKEKYLCAHPCINTSTLRINFTDLTEKFLPETKHNYTIVDL